MCDKAQRDGRPLGGSKLRSYFSPACRPKFNKLSLHVQERSQFVAPFSMTISCCVPEIFAIKLRNRRFFFWGGERRGAPIFLGGAPKSLTEFYKSGSPSNMWQSSVTIDRATPEIRRRRKEKKIKTSAAKHNGIRG